MAEEIRRMAHVLRCNMESIKHFITEVGEPAYETWLGYPNCTAIDEDEEKSKEFAQRPDFLELTAPISKWFQRVNSRTMRET